MASEGLNQAISILQAWSDRPSLARANREVFVAFVWLDTLLHHWPSLVSAEQQQLHQLFLFFKKEEYSRYLKQRRLALSRLSKQINYLETLQQ